MSEYGDFEEVVEEPKDGVKKVEAPVEQTGPVRVRLPYKGQLIGVVLERLGGKRMSVKATDGKTRNCRVPGKYRRKFWLRPGNYVLIEPWPDDDDKGDIVFQYRGGNEHQLKKKGLVDGLNDGF